MTALTTPGTPGIPGTPGTIPDPEHAPPTPTPAHEAHVANRWLNVSVS